VSCFFWSSLFYLHRFTSTRSLVIYDQVVVSGSTLYAIGLAKSFASYTLHITTLSSATGELLTDIHLPSNIANKRVDFFPIAQSGKRKLYLVWLEEGTVKYVALTPDLTNTPKSIAGSGYEQIIDLRLGDSGIFLARRKDGSSYVFQPRSGKVEQTWEFADSVSLIHSQS
jgi:ER membrane protein complex subunit 1